MANVGGNNSLFNNDVNFNKSEKIIMARIKNTLRLDPDEFAIINQLQRDEKISFSDAVRQLLNEHWLANGFIHCPDCGYLHDEKYCPNCGL